MVTSHSSRWCSRPSRWSTIRSRSCAIANTLSWQRTWRSACIRTSWSIKIYNQVEAQAVALEVKARAISRWWIGCKSTCLPTSTITMSSCKGCSSGSSLLDKLRVPEGSSIRSRNRAGRTSAASSETITKLWPGSYVHWFENRTPIWRLQSWRRSCGSSSRWLRRREHQLVVESTACWYAKSAPMSKISDQPYWIAWWLISAPNMLTLGSSARLKTQRRHFRVWFSSNSCDWLRNTTCQNFYSWDKRKSKSASKFGMATKRSAIKLAVSFFEFL